ncbi:hypothetical protein NC652_036248 [Populus alba x Populus x berolinensis]|nr:hypothetical protein NC652_036248 [Populus alba x Populus x berolinensis]
MDGAVVRRNDMGMKHGENLPLWPSSMLDLQTISKNKTEMNLDSIIWADPLSIVVFLATFSLLATLMGWGGARCQLVGIEKMQKYGFSLSCVMFISVDDSLCSNSSSLLAAALLNSVCFRSTN